MSGYRDDREALHNRVAQLEEELADARKEGEKQGRDDAEEHARALETKIAGMRDDLERMQNELDAMRGRDPGPPRAKGNPAVIAGVAGVVLAVGGIGVVLARSSSSHEVHVPVALPTPPPEPLPKVTPPREPVALPRPVASAPPPPPSRSTTAKWTATVARADGLPLAPGSACTIEATITARETNALVPQLSVTCGSQKLYDSSDALNGMAQMRNDAREKLGPNDDKSVFTMVYRDIGSRTGARTQIDLDSNVRQGAVFRDTIPRFRVELNVPQTSVPTTALAGAEQRLRRTGKLTETSGAATVKVGTSCVLRAMPIGKGKDCVAEVACGTSILFPSTAKVTCTYAVDKTTDVTGDDDANALAIDGTSLTLKTKTLGATITLDP